MKQIFNTGVITLKDEDEERKYFLQGYNPPEIEEGAIHAEILSGNCVVIKTSSQNLSFGCPYIYNEILDYSEHWTYDHNEPIPYEEIEDDD